MRAGTGELIMDVREEVLAGRLVEPFTPARADVATRGHWSKSMVQFLWKHCDVRNHARPPGERDTILFILVEPGASRADHRYTLSALGRGEE